ncbi:GtrA family protein [Vreelandella aquamarina]|jgi:putative flippase GtrA|uniref:GtrA family protein n=1 Tax=Vreelandella aquamarina TaxID=77097 RepID=UPI000E98D28C|nr:MULTISPECIES: GtrA family protein [Halomonas]MCC4292666.1 GtrA family protein [Halomonas axialensis]HBN58937.1 GtrA family protein [Halomonas sp.]|tara:strand:+ start:85 stop:462 length:378 start_codon:yes stop_codon:yes gene_type:complete
MKRLMGEAGMLARFGGVGAIATLVHLSVAAIAFIIWPTISPFLANLLAFVVAFQVSFWGHRRFTFRKDGRAHRFFLLALGGFALNNSVLAALLAISPVEGIFAIIVATFTVPLLMYVAARFWAFA